MSMLNIINYYHNPVDYRMKTSHFASKNAAYLSTSWLDVTQRIQLIIVAYIIYIWITELITWLYNILKANAIWWKNNDVPLCADVQLIIHETSIIRLIQIIFVCKYRMNSSWQICQTVWRDNLYSSTNIIPSKLVGNLYM